MLTLGDPAGRDGPAYQLGELVKGLAAGRWPTPEAALRFLSLPGPGQDGAEGVQLGLAPQGAVGGKAAASGRLVGYGGDLQAVLGRLTDWDCRRLQVQVAEGEEEVTAQLPRRVTVTVAADMEQHGCYEKYFFVRFPPYTDGVLACLCLGGVCLERCFRPVPKLLRCATHLSGADTPQSSNNFKFLG
jgi:hypothetical protein